MYVITPLQGMRLALSVQEVVRSRMKPIVLYMDWNENEKNTKKYHIVGVLQLPCHLQEGQGSSGLNANDNMRSYGLGVDQVQVRPTVQNKLTCFV